MFNIYVFFLKFKHKCKKECASIVKYSFMISFIDLCLLTPPLKKSRLSLEEIKLLIFMI